ncbi:hypothetical protein ElyMa_003567600 [Elysia marginata]|uniref:Death domain-containing protein n=1 Tax=Elysia marginata TaxID=1093978 RepID=A0AAV4ELD6_9GAST|nr:hypothetical protein ElyMa_003567600 [Elysia marginata]
MGLYKNTDPEEKTSIETNTSQSQDQKTNNLQGEQLVRGVQGGAEAIGDGPSTCTSLPADDEVIPWEFVPPPVVRKLVQKLNPESYLSGNNWRALAGALGHTCEEIRFIESVQGIHSEVLLKEFAIRQDASLNEMLHALQSINRKDCVEIISNSLPEIRQKIQASLNKPPMLRMAEAPSSILSGHNGVMWSNGPTMLMPAVFQNGASTLMPMSQPTAAGMCYMLGHVPMSCGQAVAFNGDRGLSQPGSSSFPSVGEGNAAYNTACKGLTATTGSMLCSDTRKGNCTGRAPQGAMLEQQQQQQQQRLQQTMPSRENYGELGCMMMDSPSPVHNSFPGMSGDSYSTNPNNNMSNSIRTCCEGSRHTSPQMVGGGGTTVRQSMFRQFSDGPQVGQYHSRKQQYQHSISVQGFGPTACHHSGGDTQPSHGTPSSTPFNSHSSGSGCFPLSPSTPVNCGSQEKYPTGYGEDCAGTVNNNGSPRKLFCTSSSSPPLGERGHSSSSHASSGSFHNTCNAGFTSSSEDQTTNSAGVSREQGRQQEQQGTNLSPLEKMEAMSDKYKPSSNYQTVVAEQKIAVDGSKKTKSFKSATKQSSVGTGGGGSSFNSFGSNTSGGSSGSSTVCSASQTFPMRVKVRQERDGRGGQGGVVSGGQVPGVEDLGSLTISKKSVSMPQNMKPQPYRKAWRGIKVFVTYSMDNATHNDQVLCLGYFLKNNGFNCYLDTPYKPGKSSEAWLVHMDKFQRKFYESDFVLVCLSPKYLQDVSVSEVEAAAHQSSGESRLHTLDIYQLMNREYLNRQAFGDHEACGGRLGQPPVTLTSSSSSSSDMPSSPQVVPVLFGNMTASQIPPWMLEVGVPCKRWEADYADLAWLLTKPQNRIRPTRQQSAYTGDSSSSSSSF